MSKKRKAQRAAPSAAAPRVGGPSPVSRGDTAATVLLLLLLTVVVAMVLGALENVKAAVLENCRTCSSPARPIPSATRGGTTSP